MPDPGGSYVGHNERYERLERERIEHGRNLAERVSEDLRKKGFGSEELVLVGRAGPQLLKEADNLNADLVVVGSRGLGAVRRAVLGSVGDQVVRHAPATLVGRTPELIRRAEPVAVTEGGGVR